MARGLRNPSATALTAVLPIAVTLTLLTVLRLARIVSAALLICRCQLLFALALPASSRLLAFLAASLATLRRNLIAANLWNDVVVMTYSEFGRRAKQNASGGTDHGTAAPIFVMGGGVKGGLYGAYPSLGDLQDGDLKHTVDFRNVFATVAQGCWGLQRDFGLRQPQRLGFLA